MSRKFVSKAMVCAAFGAAALLVSSPGVGLADDKKDDHHKERVLTERIYTEPKPVKAGGKALIIEICAEAQKHPQAFSKPIGTVDLIPHTDVKDHDKKLKELKDHFKKHHDHKHHDDKKHEDKKHEEPKHHDDKKHDHKHHDDKKHEEPKKHDDKHHDDLKKLDDLTFDGKKGPFAYFVKVTIPKDTKPGVYKLEGSCAEGKLVVAPHGWVDGGDGGVAGASGNALLASGAAMLAAAAVGGTVLMRRRTADETLA